MMSSPASRLAPILPFRATSAPVAAPQRVNRKPGVLRRLFRWILFPPAGFLLLWAAESSLLPVVFRTPALWTGAVLLMLALFLVLQAIWKISRAVIGLVLTNLLFGLGIGGAVLVVGTAARRAAGYSLDAVLADPSRPEILFRDGSLYTRPDSGCRPAASIGDIPLHLQQAVVAVEDSRYYQHEGVDLRGLAGAVKDTVLGKARGGSTLLMQLIDNRFSHSESGGFHRRVWYKFVEIFAARRLFDEAAVRFGSADEARRRILLAYLNRVEFGRGQVGAAAAAYYWFAQPDLKKITLGQAAQLAGMLQNQRKYDPLANPEAAAARREIVLNCMVNSQFITAKEAGRDRCDLDRTPRRARPLHDGFLPHRVECILDIWNREGLIHAAVELHHPQTRITLTLDQPLQAHLEDTVKSRAAWIRSQTPPTGPRLSELEAAAVVLRNDDASIAALMSGLRYDKSATDNLFVARHLPASTLKPFLYAAVPGLSAETRFSNHPLTAVDTSPFRWNPENPSGLPPGWHPLSAVLARSDNWAAGRTGWRYRREITSLCEKLRISPLSAEQPSLHPDYAIGTRAVRLIDLAAAGRALACEGRWRAAWLIQSVTARGVPQTPAPSVPEQIVIPPASARLLRMALHETLVSGTASTLRSTLGIRRDTWAKTGTSEDNRDCLILGGDSRYTVLLWFGRLKGSDPILPHCSGASICGPVLTELVRIR